MTWCWPLRTEGRTWPGPPGQFGAVRKHDVHTGVDLYCNPGTEVQAAEDGEVVEIEDFTGSNAGSPWWHDTRSILVLGASGVICYGELEPLEGLQIGSRVLAGSLLGHVKTVLKVDKGRPMTMLHLELYESGVRESVWWRHDETRPPGLRDPTNFLKEAFFEYRA